MAPVDRRDAHAVPVIALPLPPPPASHAVCSTPAGVPRVDNPARRSIIHPCCISAKHPGPCPAHRRITPPSARVGPGKAREGRLCVSTLMRRSANHQRRLSGIVGQDAHAPVIVPQSSRISCVEAEMVYSRGSYPARSASLHQWFRIHVRWVP